MSTNEDIALALKRDMQRFKPLDNLKTKANALDAMYDLGLEEATQNYLNSINEAFKPRVNTKDSEDLKRNLPKRLANQYLASKAPVLNELNEKYTANKQKLDKLKDYFFLKHPEYLEYLPERDRKEAVNKLDEISYTNILQNVLEKDTKSIYDEANKIASATPNKVKDNIKQKDINLTSPSVQTALQDIMFDKGFNSEAEAFNQANSSNKSLGRFNGMYNLLKAYNQNQYNNNLLRNRELSTQNKKVLDDDYGYWDTNTQSKKSLKINNANQALIAKLNHYPIGENLSAADAQEILKSMSEDTFNAFDSISSRDEAINAIAGSKAITDLGLANKADGKPVSKVLAHDELASIGGAIDELKKLYPTASYSDIAKALSNSVRPNKEALINQPELDNSDPYFNDARFYFDNGNSRKYLDAYTRLNEFYQSSPNAFRNLKDYVKLAPKIPELTKTYNESRAQLTMLDKQLKTLTDKLNHQKYHTPEDIVTLNALMQQRVALIQTVSQSGLAIDNIQTIMDNVLNKPKDTK